RAARVHPGQGDHQGPGALAGQRDHARPHRQGPEEAPVDRHPAARQAVPLRPGNPPGQELPSRTVHGIWPTTLATIKVWLGGSHTMPVSAGAGATPAGPEAALAGSSCRWSSPVTIMISNRPSPPSVPGTQFGIEDLHRLRLLAGTWHAAPPLGPLTG